MKKNLMFTLSVILGILSGLCVSGFILAIENVIVSYLEIENVNFNITVIYIAFRTGAILAFILVVKWVTSSRRKRLSMYCLIAILISVGGAIIWWIGSVAIFNTLFSINTLQSLNETKEGLLVLYCVVYALVFGMVLTFVISFLFLINRKVKYIQYISEEVTKIETEGFGNTMIIRGDDELAQLSLGINSMSITLKEKNDMEKEMEKNKNELVTNVSHDLRTPLTSIVGYVNLIKENGFNDKEKFDEYIEVVERRLGGLNMLINELFEYSKLNSSYLSMDVSDVDIIGILEHLFNEYHIIYEKEGLQLIKNVYIEHCMIKIDEPRIIRVFQNLLENARRYAVEGSVIQAAVFVEENYLVVDISNMTEQVIADDINKVFDRFYKGDKARSEADSSGLGLSIVKRILELHRGTIRVKLENSIISFQLKLPII